MAVRLRQEEERDHAVMEKVVRGRGRTEGNPRSRSTDLELGNWEEV